MVALAAKSGTSLVTALRTFRNLSDLELAAKTGMPVARFGSAADHRLSVTDDELDQIATALGVEVDLLMNCKPRQKGSPLASR